MSVWRRAFQVGGTTPGRTLPGALEAREEGPCGNRVVRVYGAGLAGPCGLGKELDFSPQKAVGRRGAGLDSWAPRRPLVAASRRTIFGG